VAVLLSYSASVAVLLSYSALVAFILSYITHVTARQPQLATAHSWPPFSATEITFCFFLISVYVPSLAYQGSR
jgi:hypothetical protein